MRLSCVCVHLGERPTHWLPPLAMLLIPRCSRVFMRYVSCPNSALLLVYLRVQYVPEPVPLEVAKPYKCSQLLANITKTSQRKQIGIIKRERGLLNILEQKRRSENIKVISCVSHLHILPSGRPAGERSLVNVVFIDAAVVVRLTRKHAGESILGIAAEIL